MRSADPASLEDLEKMHTGSLMARLKLLRSLPSSKQAHDWTKAELAAHSAQIVFSDHPRWKQAWNDVKAVLETREHIDRGGKGSRQAAAAKRFEK